MAVYIRGSTSKGLNESKELRFLDFTPMIDNESKHKVLLDEQISKSYNKDFSKCREITKIVCECK